MNQGYGQPDITNLVYNNTIEQLVIHSGNTEIFKKDKVNRERKYNNDMKLLLAEINFINRYVNCDNGTPLIVYIGSSPGFHLVKLMKMFPFIKFHLYDPISPHPELEKYIEQNEGQVKFFKELFTLETCDRYKENSFYLITDFKDDKYTKDPYFAQNYEAKKLWQLEKEKSYNDDMELQKQICIKIKPIFSFLRFRLPHYYGESDDENVSFEYFHGVIWLMIYNDMKSNEARIAVNDYSESDFKWNYQIFQYRINYFNIVMRESLLLNPFTNDQSPIQNQLGNKFETVLMIKIILEYFKSIGYVSPRQSEILDFYSNFLVAETCSDVAEICEESKYEIEEQELFEIN